MASKPTLTPATLDERARRAAAQLPIEADELHEPDVAAYIARNQDALAASIRTSRSELGEGAVSTRTLDEIFAGIRRRLHRRA